MKFFFKPVSWISFLFLFACGGGGSSSDAEIINPITPPTPNDLPECNPSGYEKTLYCTYTRLGLDREFYVYVPDDIYSKTANPPLLFNLHGYRRQAVDFLGYSGFQILAEEDKLIVIYPQGSILPSSGEPHWNDTGWSSESPADDVDFISSLIDWSLTNYQINPNRVYATGKSNGGKMSYHLACNLRYRIAGVASVGGTMNPNTYLSCNPSHPTPIIHIHSEDDTVVPIDGNWRSLPLTEMMDYWNTYNACEDSRVTAITDENNDGESGEVFLNYSCLNQVETKLFLTKNMGHDWPTDLNSYDIIAADEIWKFLKQFDMNGKIQN